MRSVVEAFVRRMADDRIIGFFFEGKDLTRVIRHEQEHALAVLGLGAGYTGRPIPALHKPLKINAGQFRRRLALLQQAMAQAGLPEGVQARWLDAQRAMEAAITDGTDCV